MSTSLEYHHVSQFYQTVLFFLIPLLTVQSIYICVRGIISQYEEAKLKEIKRWEKYEDTYQVDVATGMEPQQIQDYGEPIRDSQRRSMRISKNVSSPQLIRTDQENNQIRNKQQLLDQSVEEKKNNDYRKQSQEIELSSSLQNAQNAQKQQVQDSNSREIAEEKKQQNIEQQVNNNAQQTQQVQTHPNISFIISTQQRKSINHQSQDENQAKQQQHKDQNVQKQMKSQESVQNKQLTKEQQQKQIEIAINYAFKIDEIFDYYMPIIVCIIVLGILTESVFIFSMFCFFCFLFSTLLFNYADVITRLKQVPSQSSLFVRINYLVSGVFIFVLFLSYWSADEYQV